MRVILVPIADRPECAAALKTALQLAERIDADLVGCHIRPHRDSSVALPAGLIEGLEVGWSGRKSESAAKRDSAKARELFNRMCDEHGVPSRKRPGGKGGQCGIWREMVGSPGKVLAILGPVSDMIVVSRPQTKSSHTARLFMLSALMNTARPVLILPPKGKSGLGKRVMIAWNQSHEAMHAVTSAMPILRAAEQVVVFSSGPESNVGPKSSHVTNYLAHWGIKARRVHIRGRDEGRELRASMKETRSDLLVMGAYGHGRLREKLFGGITERMLTSAPFAVFMQHI